MKNSTNVTDNSGKLSTNSCEIFGGLGCVRSNKPFDFGDDPDPGILNGIFSIAENLRELPWLRFAVSESF